jgi:hypothetical protein
MPGQKEDGSGSDGARLSLLDALSVDEEHGVADVHDLPAAAGPAEDELAVGDLLADEGSTVRETARTVTAEAQARWGVVRSQWGANHDPLGVRRVVEEGDLPDTLRLGGAPGEDQGQNQTGFRVEICPGVVDRPTA